MNPKMAGYLILQGGFLVLLDVLGARGIRGSLPPGMTALGTFIGGRAWRTGTGWLALNELATIVQGASKNRPILAVSPRSMPSMLRSGSGLLFDGHLIGRTRAAQRSCNGHVTGNLSRAYWLPFVSIHPLASQ